MNRSRIANAFSTIPTTLDGASTPWPLALPAAQPNLVACPNCLGVSGAFEDIYRLAYEQAVAATQVSRFERANQASLN